ncbi:hypothetical protein SISSUDRAFT_518680 [Sistotremastrum suecicum HHB10207 ss-3]|uniref:Uncharacterized protein n=1 Tax=Sistotremastrum suecicum HHB10207 ss-3 TaxID=1314776 RepID=A0A166F9J4_9AGAM|nr:hypothetical protein SISSUDRAFT_518680 [Sistotremastrum suecicum HHB10207 ss-3]
MAHIHLLDCSDPGASCTVSFEIVARSQWAFHWKTTPRASDHTASILSRDLFATSTYSHDFRGVVSESSLRYKLRTNRLADTVFSFDPCNFELSHSLLSGRTQSSLNSSFCNFIQSWESDPQTESSCHAFRIRTVQNSAPRARYLWPHQSSIRTTPARLTPSPRLMLRGSGGPSNIFVLMKILNLVCQHILGKLQRSLGDP